MCSTTKRDSSATVSTPTTWRTSISSHYLVDHRDGREGNFLVAEDDSRRQVFSIDNGIAFGPFFYNYFVKNWTKLRVAAVRQSSVDRLRAVQRSDLDFLAVVDQMQLDDQGLLQPVATTAPMQAGDGATWQDGVLQIGLTTREIDGIYDRIRPFSRRSPSTSLSEKPGGLPREYSLLVKKRFAKPKRSPARARPAKPLLHSATCRSSTVGGWIERVAKRAAADGAAFKDQGDTLIERTRSTY